MDIQKMKNENKITYNLFFSFLSQLTTILLGIAIPRIVMTGYGSEVNGFLSSVHQFVIYLSLFESGINQVALKSLYQPVHNGDVTAINRILSAVNNSYKKVGTFYLIGLIGLAIIYPLTIKLNAIGFFTAFLVILFSGLGNAILFFFQGKYRIYLQADGKNYILTNIQTVITIANNLVKIFLLSLDANVAVVVMCTFFISLVQSIYLYTYVKKNCIWMDYNVEPDDKALEQKNSMLIHQIAALVFQNTDVLIITIFCGLKEVSIYSVYKLVLAHMNSFLTMIYSSFNYYLGQLFQIEKTRYIKMIDMVEVYYSAIIFSVYAVVSCLLLPFVRLYTKGVHDIQYEDLFLAVLFVCVEVLTYMRIPMLNTINYAGAFRDTLPQTIIESVLNIVISLVGVYFFGIYGTLIGTIAALLYRTIEVIIYANTKLLNRMPWKTFLIYIINIAGMFMVIMLYYTYAEEIIQWTQFIKTGFILSFVALASNITLVSIVFHKEAILLLKITRKLILR